MFAYFTFAANPQSRHARETSPTSNKGKLAKFVISFLLMLNYHDKAITMPLQNFQVFLRIDLWDGTSLILARPRKTRLLPITKVLGINLPSRRMRLSLVVRLSIIIIVPVHGLISLSQHNTILQADPVGNPRI